MCIFCKIVAGIAPAHKIWEDDEYLAILSIFPNTDGFTVVFPKIHMPSYAFALEDAELIGLTLAARKVALLLDRAFDDVGRTGMIFEGYGVDHVHAKLFPMHGTSKTQPWQKISSNVNKFFDKYEGYISSHDHQRADEGHLKRMVEKIGAMEKKNRHGERDQV
jgi:diadenosine tetraphosphate (Ap4A) HIT family hydrolase